MLYIKLFIEGEKNIGQSAPECPFKCKSDISSLDFVVNRSFMKLFQTNNIDIVNYCRAQFEFDLPSTVVGKRTGSKKFVAKYRSSENVICKFA